MSVKPLFRALPLLLLVAALGLSGCSQYFQISSKSGTAPTPVVSEVKGGVDDPTVFVDPAAFRAAVLKALEARDGAQLQKWMTVPFLTGTWRADLSDTSPLEAVKALFAEELSASSSLSVVEGADLKALLGGKDPLSIPRSDAGVMDAFLVSGWGKDGKEEAILFVARQPDNSLKLNGWMVVKGGFSGARLGGVQLYQSDAHGFSLFLPKGYEVSTPAANYVVFLAPGEGPGRGGAYMYVDPANGRTAEQVVEAIKAEHGPGFNIAIDTVMGIEDAQALVVTGIPGQDSNRQLFMVHNDLLYHIVFSPDNPADGVPYQQMEDLYAMVVNTFHFTW